MAEQKQLQWTADHSFDKASKKGLDDVSGSYMSFLDLFICLFLAISATCLETIWHEFHLYRQHKHIPQQ